MATNVAPIFTKKGNLSANGGTTMIPALLLAAADYTGAGANNILIHTAGADGSYVKKIKFIALGTNIATVCRIYLNNGSVNTSSTNNHMLGQISLPATTAIATAATSEPEYPLEMMIPPLFRLYVGLGTAVAAGWDVTAISADY